MSYSQTTISVINNGMIQYTKYCNFSAWEIEKTLKNCLILDNVTSTKKKIKQPELLPCQISPILGDLVARSSLCVSRAISKTLFEDPKQLSKIKNDNDYSKIDFYPNIQDFYISYISRISLGESFFQSDENNLAYQLMTVLMEIPCEDRTRLCQNVILSGGMSMILGLNKRLGEEIDSMFDKKEFEILLPLRNVVRLHKILFPRNCLNWIGLSLISNFDKLNLKHLTLNKEEFTTENLNKIFSFFK
jgi:actin-related protein